MTRVQVWHTIPAEYELACDEMRLPLAGEWYLNFCGTACLATCTHDIVRVIIRKVWEWPPWLHCDWVARNKDGNLALGQGQHSVGSHWHFGSRNQEWVSKSLLAINLPPCDDWKLSVRMNPNKTVVE